VGLGREYDETTRTKRGSVGKELKKTVVEQRGQRGVLYSARKRRLARARALPDREAAKPGGADRRTEIIYY
jgi:hypothetical protein